MITIKQRLFNRKQAAEYLGIDPKTVWRWATENKIPSLFVSGRRKYDRRVLDKMIEENSFPE